jgi:hypothetical protein
VLSFVWNLAAHHGPADITASISERLKAQDEALDSTLYALRGTQPKNLQCKLVADVLFKVGVLEQLAEALVRAAEAHSLNAEDLLSDADALPSVLKAAMDGSRDAIAKTLAEAAQARRGGGRVGGGGVDTREVKGQKGEKKAQKFSLIQGMFGSKGLFRRGLEGLIGLPSMKVYDAMKAEHESAFRFTSLNYGIETTPKQEWEFVTDAKEGLYPGEKEVGSSDEGRVRKSLDELMQLPECESSGVTREELIAVRLYTGPMYMYYNQQLRKALDIFMTQELVTVMEHWIGKPCACELRQEKSDCDNCRSRD